VSMNVEPGRFASLSATIALLWINPAYADEDYGRIGSLAFSAWECAALSALAGDHSEFERLFTLGQENARLLVEAAQRGEVSREAQAQVPIGLTLNLVNLADGLSTDFRLGALWARIEAAVYDENWEQIDGASFDQMTELSKSSAKNALQNAHCELLK